MKHVTGSTISAETLALTKDSDTAIFIACLVEETIFSIKKEVNTEIFTHN